jgi:hypothetical protein
MVLSCGVSLCGHSECVCVAFACGPAVDIAAVDIAAGGQRARRLWWRNAVAELGGRAASRSATSGGRTGWASSGRTACAAPDVPVPELVHGLHEVDQRAAEAVRPPHHDGVAFAREGEGLGSPGSIGLGA